MRAERPLRPALATGIGDPQGQGWLRPVQPRPRPDPALRLSVPLQPAKPGVRLPGRPVLAADPASVAELAHAPEHIVPADLACAGLVARGHVGDLDVRDHRYELLHALGDVALGDLHMIDVELEPDPVAPERL